MLMIVGSRFVVGNKVDEVGVELELGNEFVL